MHLDEKHIKVAPRKFRLHLTHCFIAICLILYFWINVQQRAIAQSKGALAASMSEVPLLQKLMFDYPPDMQSLDHFVATHDLKGYSTLEELPGRYHKELHAIELIPTWKGLMDLLFKKVQGEPSDLTHVVLFDDIRQGEYWRLVTPTFLHYQFLHLLFNMAWLWMLGIQIEHRLGKFKLLIMTLIIAIITNVTQYLMTGPLFLGYSGVVVGMAGFIWLRQRIAPWEGYPLAKATSLFLLIFILAVLVLESVAFLLQIFRVIDQAPNIANTAHIVGGLVGMGLAKVPYFKRKVS